MTVTKLSALLTRRKMLQGGAAMAASAMLPGCGSTTAPAAAGQSVPSVGVVNPQPTPTGSLTAASLTVTTTTIGSVGAAFAGLSYEKDSFESPRFTTANTQLSGLFTRLGPSLLRIGGNTVDQYVWTPNGKGQTSGQVAPPDIVALAAFLKATGWQCLYGINLAGSANGTQTTTLAAAEVTYVAATLGTSLYGIEIGNECDLYGSATAANGVYAGTGWSVTTFETLWKQYRAAIVAAVPNIVVTGPASASNEASWTVPFGQNVTKSDISLLTQHYYKDSGIAAQDTATYLTSNPDTGLQSDFVKLAAGASGIGVPFRMSECNSFYDGGTPGVPDGYGSALWAVDFLFDCALGGSVGVNFHTVGTSSSGSYSAISDGSGKVNSVNPEFYGILFFTLAGTGSLYTTALLEGTVALPASTLNVTAYAVKAPSGTGLNLVLVNKDPAVNLQLSVTVPQTVATASLIAMTGTSLTAQTGQLIQGSGVGLSGAFTPAAAYGLGFTGSTVSCYVPALTAVLVALT